MAKRLTLQEKQNMFIEDILNKMFEIAGHSVTYNDIKDRNDIWKECGISEIRKRFKYNKSWAEREMGMISLMWGLKFSDCIYENDKEGTTKA